MNRYSRQERYNNIGTDGQPRIEGSTVLIVGAGALGSSSSEMLARAGVKKLILVDRDYVEPSNLQRQNLYSESDAAEKTPKVIAAEKRLADIRSDLEVEVHIAHCDAALIESLAGAADIILDGTDNFDTRLLINDTAFKLGIPWVYAACVEASYTSCGFVPGKTPCYRCLVPVLPQTALTCDTAGIIAPAVQTAVSEQVTTALKIMTEQFQAPYYMRVGNLWDMDHMKFKIDGMKDPVCPACSSHASYPALSEDAGSTMKLCGRDTVQYIDEKLDKKAVTARLFERGIHFRETPYFIEFRFEEYRLVNFHDGRFLIHGTSDMNKSRTIINQIFG